MVEVPITIACGNYDRTRAHGRPGQGRGLRSHLPAALSRGDLLSCVPLPGIDVCELSFSSHIRTVAAGTSAYAGIPAFVSRMFRHSGIYVRADPGIAVPDDLRGRRIGVPEYQITAVVWMRGMLQHEYNVAPAEIHWRSGGQEEPGRDERTTAIPGIDLEPIDRNETLVGLLRDRKLDALFTARAPSSFLRGEPHIRRLFATPAPPSRPTTSGPGCSR